MIGELFGAALSFAITPDRNLQRDYRARSRRELEAIHLKLDWVYDEAIGSSEKESLQCF